MRYLPIALKIRGEKVIVVGGGEVAQRKIMSLLSAEGKVILIAPEVTAKLKTFAKKSRIKWLRRQVRKDDILGATLVIAATNNTFLNKRVSGWAQDQNIAINVVDQPLLSNFISPAVFKKARALVTVYTNGKDPVLSRDLKNYLKENWNDFLLYRSRS